MLLPGWCAEDTDATDCEDTDATEAEDEAAAADVDAIEALTESKYVVSVSRR